jgi:hypothetical protein
LLQRGPGSNIDPMRIDGRCHCGAITYEAEVDPETTGICHCTDCQTLTGTAFRVTVRAPAEHFVLRGKPTIYVKTADSGRKRAHAFCPTCGSPIYATSAENATVYSLRLGLIRQRKEMRPRREIWCASALPWSRNLGALGLEHNERQP